MRTAKGCATVRGVPLTTESVLVAGLAGESAAVAARAESERMGLGEMGTMASEGAWTAEEGHKGNSAAAPLAPKARSRQRRATGTPEADCSTERTEPKESAAWGEATPATASAVAGTPLRALFRCARTGGTGEVLCC